MAAQIIPFPRARASVPMNFDEVIDAFDRLARIADRDVSAIKQAIFQDLRQEQIAILTRAGIMPTFDHRGR